MKDEILSVFAIFRNLINRGHERSVKTKKNILASFLIKGGNITISLILVPLTIHYVNPTQYGIWLTLSSIIGWFTFFDIGFGNGLRNKFAEAIAKGEDELARVYLSTTYAILSIIVIALLIFFFCINPFLNWSLILNAPEVMAGELSLVALLFFSFFCLQFIFQLITIIIIANQQSAKASFLNFLGSLLSLIVIFILTKTTSGKLIYLALCLGLAPVLILIVTSIWLYGHEYKIYAPSLKYVKFSYAYNMGSLGLKFFIIQISVIVLYSTDNVIITQLYGPKEVIAYNISFKYFSVILSIFTIIASPFWSAITEAYTKNDLIWIKRSMKNLLRISIFFSLLAIIMVIFSNSFYRLWVGDKIQVPFLLSILMGFYFILSLFLHPFTNFINGIGYLKIQLIQSSIAAIINIPLAIFFAKPLNLGISGIILATIVCYIPGVILAPMQYEKIIKNRAKGIWLK